MSGLGIGTVTPNESLQVYKGNINIEDNNALLTPNGYMIGDQFILTHNGNYRRLYVGIKAGNTTATGWYNTCLGSYTGNNLSSGDNNTFVGARSGVNIGIGGYNTATGVEALASGISPFPFLYTGSCNTATGYRALYNTSSNNNTANGYAALLSNTTGWANTAVGYSALTNNTTGGQPFMNFNTQGMANTAIGSYAMYNNTTGSGNSALGEFALQSNILGEGNVAIGAMSLTTKIDGSFNTAIGNLSLYQNPVNCTIQNNNSALGYAARVQGHTPPYSNSSAIGNKATATNADWVQLGNATTNGTGGAGFILWSDGRFKFNITENVHGLDFIVKLKPVTYQLNTEKLDDFQNKDLSDSLKIIRKEGMNYTAATSRIHSGFIAQQVDSAAQAAGFTSSIVYVPSDTSEQIYGLAYAELVVPLVKAVQELNAKSGSDYDFLIAGNDKNPTSAGDIDSIKYTRGYLEINNGSTNPAAVLEVQNKSSIANFNNTGAALFATDASNFTFTEDTLNTGYPQLINIISDITNIPAVTANIVGIKSHITSSSYNGENVASLNQIDGRCGYNIGVKATAREAGTNAGIYSEATTSEHSPFAYGIQAYTHSESGECLTSFNYGSDCSAKYGYYNLGGQFIADGTWDCGFGQSTSIGVLCRATNGGQNYGIWAEAPIIPYQQHASVAGYFNGNVDYTGTLSHVSDAKFKHNIVNLPHGLSLLEQLRPRTYTFNLTQYPFMHFSPEPQYGFVAQEIGSVLPNVTGNSVFRAEYDSTGHMIHDTIQYKSVNYIGIIPVIVAAVQELKAKGDSVTHNLNTKIDSLKQVINNYQSKFNLYDDQLNNLQQMINNCCKVNNNRTKEDPTGGSIPNSNTNYQMVELATENIIILDQNSPNPFEQETDITYYLPETVNNAKIMFYDNSGIIIKAVELNGKGNGALHVYASNLSAGLYTYALIVDGKLIDSKKMVCTKK